MGQIRHSVELVLGNFQGTNHIPGSYFFVLYGKSLTLLAYNI